MKKVGREVKKGEKKWEEGVFKRVVQRGKNRRREVGSVRRRASSSVLDK